MFFGRVTVTNGSAAYEIAKKVPRVGPVPGSLDHLLMRRALAGDVRPHVRRGTQKKI
jgi:hypothetical protein